MRTYLATLHTRSDKHKKRFALLTSGGITLSIFFVWMFVRFSPLSSNDVVATDDTIVPTSDNTASAIAPINNLSSGVKESFQNIKDQFNSVKGSVKEVNLETEYQQMRNDAVNNSDKQTQ